MRFRDASAKLTFLLGFCTFLLQSQSRAVKPLEVLQRHCVECHNAHDKKGGVVLDRGPIVIDDLQQIVKMVSGQSPKMPPKRDPLSIEEVKALQLWVASGAEIPEGRVLTDTRIADRQWWSLKPLRKPAVPEAGDGWAKNEIDHFVTAKLREKGLKHSPEADARTLIRRLTFDLIGLPPTPEEIRTFVRDSQKDRDGAYAKLVERLLDSPRYGEQWARQWLDVARYGESHGYDKDKARFNAWPYRDYVIRSFNDDKPWTRFVREQVAGDVLYPKDPDGVVAMGFVAAGPWDYIAHHEVGEGKLDGRIAKHLDRDDMVSAVFNAFMSTTVQCAQCHNHKFDPVSMTDYYRLHTIFAAVDRRDRVYDLDPEIAKKWVKIESEVADLDKKLRDIDKAIETEGGAELKEIKARVAKLKEAGKASLKYVAEHGYHSHIVKQQDTEKWVQLELADSAEFSTVRLRACYDDFAGIKGGFGFPARFKVEVSDDPKFSKDARVVADHTKRNFLNPVLAPVDLPGGKGRFVRVTATKLVERKNDYIFALAEVELLDAKGRNLARGAKVTAKDSIEGGNRWGRRNLVDGKYSTGGDPKSAAELAEALKTMDSILAKVETPERLKKRDALRKQRDQKMKELDGLPEGKMVYTLATHFKPRSRVIPTKGVPRKIHLLHRGDLRNKGDEMTPGAPALWESVSATFNLGKDHTEGQRRAALAHYLTDPKNPLLWRSAANRIWLGHMGRGIVDSPNDFGRMGMKPTHPELLDWLAARFRETESVKDLHRLIVTSSTYRQASASDLQNAKIDGSNAYYWRMNRRKLRAEEVRDSVLQVAGALDLKMGGPSFRDFKFKDDHTPKFWYHLHDHNDPKTHRRTIYRFIARSQTQPFLTTLDCADPSQMVPKRDETTTALQALALMNNPFMTAMSEKFAARTKNIDEAIWLALGRAPAKPERQTLNKYAKTHGMPATARLLFNLNEFAYVD
ncbi:MAG: cytochrome C [Verrucomicrobiales bacterium]|nr:cytochrome C [Verrucomicrobiales bacterium]